MVAQECAPAAFGVRRSAFGPGGPSSERGAPSAKRYNLPAYAALRARGIDGATLGAFELTSGTYRGHAGWLYPVYGPGRALLGCRFKAAPQTPNAERRTPMKYAWVDCGEGASTTLYGAGCVRPRAPVVLCAGEPDAWLLHTLDVPACTFLRGEGSSAPQEAVAALAQRTPSLVLVAYDHDDVGQRSAPSVARALRDAGLRARALALPADLPEGGDLCDLYAARSRDRHAFLAALAGCPDLAVPPPAPLSPLASRLSPGKEGPWAAFNARTDLVELVEGVVRLRRSGRSFVGRCPFHADSSPSFHVYHDHYYCYGCQARGDAYDFDRWLKGDPL